MSFNTIEKARAQALDSILYISLPEDMQSTIGDFQIDSARLIPVEVTGDKATWNLTELSWEMIISGMLKILAWEKNNEDTPYFRDFVLAVKPELIGELTTTGILKANNGEFDLAEEIFLALTGLQPGDARAVLNLALVYDKRAEVYANLQNTEAVTYYEGLANELYRELTSADTTLPEAWLYAGYFNLRIQNYAQARKSFKEYLGLEPESDQAPQLQRILETIESRNLADQLFQEAYDYIQLSKEDEALERIESFLAQNADVWNGWFMKGWALRRLKRYAEAIPAFEKVLELGGQHVDTLNELAICCIETGMLEEARARLFDALAEEPENTKIICNLGIVYLKSGEAEEAAAYFRTVLEIDPSDVIAQQFLEESEKNFS